MSEAHEPDFGASRGSGRKVGKRQVKLTDLKVEQYFDRECTVMIWRGGTGFGALKKPGHASVLLRRSRNEGPFLSQRDDGFGVYRDPSKVRYVSFWPSGRTDKASKNAQYVSTRDGFFNHHHNMDYVAESGVKSKQMLDEGAARLQGQIMVFTESPEYNVFEQESSLPTESFGQLAHVLISLEGMAPNRTTSLGLKMDSILDWCQAFKASPDFNYKYISSSNNCAGVAVRALSAGGAEAFAAVGGCSSPSTIYCTPKDAETWAKAVRVGIQKVNAWLATLNSYSTKESAWDYRLPTVAQWKTASHKSFSFRGRETRGVDDALADWHACQQGKDPKSFPKAFGALVQLIQHTFMHMQKDPSSERNGAYRQLARCILLQVEYLAQIAARPWKEDSYYGTIHARPAAK